MFNKDTCRSCGVCLVRIALCNTCTEYVSGVCNNCDEMEDVFSSPYTKSIGEYIA